MHGDAPTWENEVHVLIAHGRDREAVMLASRNLRSGDPAGQEARDERGRPVDALEQLDQITPLLNRVAEGIDSDQLDNPTACVKYTVGDILEHMLSGSAAFAAAFRGQPTPSPRKRKAARASPRSSPPR